MALNDYHFVTTWRFNASVDEVAAIITDGELQRWWPSVYLDAREIETGDERGVGKVVDVHTKGWLPYTLRWRFRVAEIREDGFVIEALGDFVGRGIWTFRQDGSDALVTYDWQIRAEKPLLRYLTPLLRPIFAANHHWAMAQGQRSLLLELARRRATTEPERQRVPPPPQPTSAFPLPLIVGLVACGAMILLVHRRLRSMIRRRYFIVDSDKQTILEYRHISGR